MTDRQQKMKTWLNGLGFDDYNLSPASEDASFRSYHRLQAGQGSWIIMDAPPEQEPCDQFIHVARKIRDAGLSAPQVIEQNLESGFLLLSDFGDCSYLSALNADTRAALYGDALSALLQMQLRIDANDLPVYDEALLLREMDLFHDWFMQQLLDIELTESQFSRWKSIKQVLVAYALEQPQVFVHRDYHSRNLMKIESRNPGVLDFQDAVKGPISYDLVSLLRDCYIDWPPACVEQMASDYFNLARANQLTGVDFSRFKCWFNVMGAQRHLKAVGIFSRLKIRDGKAGYLKDIPRTLGYLIQVSTEEPCLVELARLISELNLSDRVKSLI